MTIIHTVWLMPDGVGHYGENIWEVEGNTDSMRAVILTWWLGRASDKLTSEQRPEEEEGESHMGMWARRKRWHSRQREQQVQRPWSEANGQNGLGSVSEGKIGRGYRHGGRNGSAGSGPCGPSRKDSAPAQWVQKVTTDFEGRGASDPFIFLKDHPG